MIKTKLKELVNKSFVTNQDLIQQLKNRSIVTQKQNTHRLHSQQSKINLIKKKSFQRLHTQQENSSFVGNNSINQSFIISSSDKAVCLLQDIIAQLGNNNKLCHKLKKVLSYVREMVNEQKKTQKLQKEHKQQLQQYYHSKMELQKQQQKKLKKINEQAIAKLNQYREKILSIRKQAVATKDAKQPTSLQQIIINQSQIIDQQCDEYYQESTQMRRLLKTQALQIQQFLKKKVPTKEAQRQDYPIKQYNSLGASFLLKH